MITRRRFGPLLLASAALATTFGAASSAQGNLPPNVFISPCGKPFRADITDPYPVGKWFAEADKNADGKLDRDEFVADAAAFFTVLDMNGDGILEPQEVRRYEHEIAPEVIGLMFVGSTRGLGGGGRLYGGRIWRAQYGGGMGGMGGMGGGYNTEAGRIDPSGDQPGDNVRPQHDIDESEQGAAPYGFFDEPEPVMTADVNLNSRIRKAAFLDLAGRHFDRLDAKQQGHLLLAELPKTLMQKRVERAQKRLPHR